MASFGSSIFPASWTTGACAQPEPAYRHGDSPRDTACMPQLRAKCASSGLNFNTPTVPVRPRPNRGTTMMNSHYRVVVIGGGVVDTSVLHHLAKFGCNGTLVLTAGSSGMLAVASTLMPI